MLCCDEFSRFLNILESSENTYTIAGKAIEEISGLLGIGRVVTHYLLSPTPLNPEGCDSKQEIFLRADGFSSLPPYERTYHTAEGGTATYSVWPSAAFLRPWNEEDKRDLSTVLDLIFLHDGRFRLIGKMKQATLTNYLTGLPNSGGFMMRIRQLFAEGRLKEYHAFSFNLKGYSLINRKFGHREGDAILKRYARLLEEFLAPEEILAHFGGDNFAALILRENVREFLNILNGTIVYGTVDGKRIPVRIQAVAGALDIDEMITEPGQVVDHCQLALQVAKNRISMPYFYVTDEIKARIYREKRISSHFHDALKNEEFRVYYQPKVDTKTYTMTGAEALVRWFWNGKIVSPADFIPLIEREGTVIDLDLYMLEHVCMDIREWILKGIEPVTVSINFSRRDISDPLLAEKILSIVDRSGIDRKYIQVEVTETTSEEETAKLIQFLSLMRKMRIDTAIDDFGSGYSSLNTLRNFDVNVIKIDRSFIANNSITKKDEIVLHNIVDMARELKIGVITEGVEHWDQLELLHKVGCYMIQGFLFDRPMPKSEFEKRLTRKVYELSELVEA